MRKKGPRTIPLCRWTEVSWGWQSLDVGFPRPVQQGVAQLEPCMPPGAAEAGRTNGI